ncbi:MAG: M23 family metallopeptidase [Microthrixaceae bacterium]
MKHRLAAVIGCALLVGACSNDSTTPAVLGEPGSAVNRERTPEVTVPDAYTAVTVQVLGDPTFPFRGTDGRYHVAYDLQLTNASAVVPATIDSVQVVDGLNPKRVVAAFTGAQLVDAACDFGDCNRLRLLNARPLDDATIAPQESRVLFIDFAADSVDELPEVVLHGVSAEAAEGPAAQVASTVDYLAAPAEVRSGEPLSIGPPVRGDGWVALNGCCEPGFPHRSSPAPFNGAMSNGQRFAIDWKRMDDNGRFFEGDKRSNDSYVDYGAEVLAVADGTVVSTLDGMEPNAPGTLPAADPKLAETITVDTVDGNHIVVDLGDGNYAFYAHLQAGSLNVTEGDTVKRGDALAKLGNTGNANASHLHLHLMDGPSPLGSKPLPYVIDGFQLTGHVAPERLMETDDFLSGRFNQNMLAEPEPRSDELPLALDVVAFPQR